MSAPLPTYPFETDRLIGSVCEVTPGNVKANLPRAAASGAVSLHGSRMGAGEVGEFVVVECEDCAILGRINVVRLPERERLLVESRLGQVVDANPIGTIQLLGTISLSRGEATSGVSK